MSATIATTPALAKGCRPAGEAVPLAVLLPSQPSAPVPKREFPRLPVRVAARPSSDAVRLVVYALQAMGAAAKRCLPLRHGIGHLG